MKIMKYTSPKGNVLLFDEFTDDRNDNDMKDGGYWVEICPTCHNKYRDILRLRSDNSGSGVASCSVYGCTNTNASWYIDFKRDEVEIMENNK